MRFFLKGKCSKIASMNILICDDNKSESARLKVMLDASGYKLKIVVFNNGCDVLDYLHSGTVIDICFLDIIMPGISGIALAEEMRTSGYSGEIVFLSSSREYGPETYTVKAFSYLIKPLIPEAVREILKKLENKKKEADVHSILIKVSKTMRNVLYQEISHIEVMNHYVYFRLTDGEEIEIYATFHDIAEQLLSDSRFVQCHRSYIVNMDDIDRIDGRVITMRNGKRIPHSRNYPDIKKKFTKWIVEGIK